MPDDRVTLYRITHERFAETPFSGEGGLSYGSRWASKGQRVSYAADHLALATLEKIAGVQRADLLAEMVYVKAHVPLSLVTNLPDEDLPSDWNALPPRAATRQVGDRWLAAQQSLLLRVPSVVLPHSYNYVINAGHPQADHPGAAALSIEIVEPHLRWMDRRVLRHLGGVGLSSPG